MSLAVLGNSDRIQVLVLYVIVGTAHIKLSPFAIDLLHEVQNLFVCLAGELWDEQSASKFLCLLYYFQVVMQLGQRAERLENMQGDGAEFLPR